MRGSVWGPTARAKPVSLGRRYDLIFLTSSDLAGWLRKQLLRLSSTILIFSSAEYCFLVARRTSFTTCSDVPRVSDFCLIDALPIATMSQKSSVLQVMQSVQLALNPDTNWTSQECQFSNSGFCSMSLAA